jgi:uncharacterized cupredoxin-like copper-binding protein
MRKHVSTRALLAAIAAVAVAAPLATDAAARPAATKATTVKVTAGKPGEFHITLSKTKVPHGKVTFTVANKGNLPHDFKIAGKKTKLIQPGKSAKLVVTFAKKGKYPYLCTVAGHAAAGMKGKLTVT